MGWRRSLLVLLGLGGIVLGLALFAGRRAAHPPAPAAPVGATVRLDGGIERRDLRFPCGDTQCAAWLYLPPDVARPPVVVMGHGFTGTRDVALPYVAERFAAAGLAAFVFDYRHFGASGGSPRQLVDPWRQIEDWRAALTAVRGLEPVDPQRVALWGSSMGGGLALLAAADDGAVRAVVAQAPQIDSSLEGEATFPGVGWAIRLVLTGWADLLSTALGGGPVTMRALAPAGEFGMLPDDAAYAAFQHAVDSGSTYRNEIVAHSVFTFDDYNPATRTSEITAPVLLIASRRDRFAPFAAVEAYAARAPNVAVELFDGDHFDIYVSPARDHAATRASDFLVRHLRD